MVIRYELDRLKIAYLMISLLFISPSAGLLVGFLSHDAQVGVAVSAGVFALASFLQGLMAWVEG